MRFIDEKIENYAINMSNTPSSICDELEVYTRHNIELPQMLIGKMEASFLGFLVRSLQVKNIVEIGTFTGYSALAMAENLPEDGQITTLDVDVTNGKVAQEFWDKSAHGHKIKQVLGPALETLPKLGFTIDLAFIDADKENYLNYLNLCLEKLSSRGIIVLDNVLWSGKVLDSNATEVSTQGIQKVNEFIASRDDLYGTLLPIRDGIFLIQKK